MQLRQKGRVEVVIFRPGIVFGPRSRWVTDLANQLSQGTAYFINDGIGICNSVYVDNLVYAMQLAICADADGEAFFVGDRELVTWSDFYRPFAEAFGIDPAHIPRLIVPEFTQSWKQRRLDPLWNSQMVQKALTLVPDDFKQDLKRTFSRSKRRTEQPVQTATTKPQPVVTQMMTELQQSQYKLPFTKAEKILGYEPIVSFDEGCYRSIKWLAEYEHFKLKDDLGFSPEAKNY